MTNCATPSSGSSSDFDGVNELRLSAFVGSSLRNSVEMEFESQVIRSRMLGQSIDQEVVMDLHEIVVPRAIFEILMEEQELLMGELEQMPLAAGILQAVRAKVGQIFEACLAA